MISAFSVDWMPPALQPNSRLHWSKKVKPRREYKYLCWVLAIGAGAKGWKRALGNHLPHVAMRFHPPDLQRRDLDNCLAAFKAGIDGIASACGVDDSQWEMSIGFGAPVKGGAVAVTITKAGGVGI